MPRIDLICLANSRKLGGRCVAGLRVDGAGWFRPVGLPPDGTLYLPDYMLTDGTEVGVLDVIQVGVHSHRPLPHQPENWVVDGSRCGLLSQPVASQLAGVLKNAIVRGPELLRGHSDRVLHTDFQQQPATASLALLAPDSIDLYHQLSYRGRPQARVHFTLGSGGQLCHYDLAITDPAWEARVIQQPPFTLRQLDAKFLLTISLGEPFGMVPYCYKLAAAIILLPPSLSVV